MSHQQVTQQPPHNEWRDTIEDHVSNDLGLHHNPANISMSSHNAYAPQFQYTSDHQVVQQRSQAGKTFSGFNEQLSREPRQRQQSLPHAVHSRQPQPPRDTYEEPPNRESIGFLGRLKESIVELFKPDEVDNIPDPNQNPEVNFDDIRDISTK